LEIAYTLVRTDLHRDKVLLSNISLLHSDEGVIKPLKRPGTSNVRSVDEKGNVESNLRQTVTARVPRHVVNSLQSRLYTVVVVNDPQIKIIGFGERFLANSIRDVKFRLNYQAPELVLCSQIGPSADIWSLGCLVSSVVCVISDFI